MAIGITESVFLILGITFMVLGLALMAKSSNDDTLIDGT